MSNGTSTPFAEGCVTLCTSSGSQPSSEAPMLQMRNTTLLWGARQGQTMSNITLHVIVAFK